jgi:predicted dehydrogenase
MINIGVIGCGHWGPNHIRNFTNLQNSKVIAVSDLDQNRLNNIKTQYPGIVVEKDYKNLLKNDNIDAVVISTPTKSHYKIAKDSLNQGKHVLCEKPLCFTVKEATKLVELSKSNKLILMVGHVFLFNNGIKEIKNLIVKKNLGNIYYISAIRTNLGPIRNDVNSVYDLASHDISIFNFLFDSLPIEVSAVGMCCLQTNIEDVTFISLKYPKNILANIRVSWLDPKKVRQITVVGNKKMVSWDDLSLTGPITIYDKGVIKEPYYIDYGEFQLITHEGDAFIPKIKKEEPLQAQARYFLECIENNKIKISNGKFGLDVVKVVDCINISIKYNGIPIKIKSR